MLLCDRISNRAIAFFVQNLRDSGFFRLTRNVASNIILSLRPDVSVNGLPSSSNSAVTNYEVLLDLEHTGSLDFSLDQVVDQVALHLEKGAVE